MKPMLTIAGNPVSDCEVLHQLQVEHGRSGFGADPEPSRATAVIIVTGGVPQWTAGDTLTIEGWFTGRITDRVMTHLEHGVASVTVTATGALATLGLRKIGDVPWPSEPGDQRAQRILDAAGVRSRVQEPGGDATVTGRDVDARTPLELLTDLATSVGATFFDDTDGTVVWQPAESRRRAVYDTQWKDTVGTWTQQTPGLRWEQVPSSPLSRPPIVIDACAIEWSPTWESSVGSVINSVTVTWGPAADPRPTVTATDDGSITRHGLRATRIDSELLLQTDALTRASRVVATQSHDRWEIGEVTVADLNDDIRALRCGDQVLLRGLPEPGGGLWRGVVEGWLWQRSVDGEAMSLRLSDPLLSLLVSRWSDLDTLRTWTTSPRATWLDTEEMR